MSVINFVHKMSPLFGVYYRFCARNVLTFFVHFIFCARNVLTFCVHFILPHFVPGNFRWPTVSVENTPSLLGRRKLSKEAGRRPAIQQVTLKRNGSISFNEWKKYVKIPTAVCIYSQGRLNRRWGEGSDPPGIEKFFENMNFLDPLPPLDKLCSVVAVYFV